MRPQGAAGPGPGAAVSAGGSRCLSAERGGSGGHPYGAPHGRGLTPHVSVRLVLSACLLSLVFWGVEWHGGLKWPSLATPRRPRGSFGRDGASRPSVGRAGVQNNLKTWS